MGAEGRCVVEPVNIEAVLWATINRITQYGWWQAGATNGTAPSRVEMLRYGTVHVEGALRDGADRDVALDKGIKAMYRFAYDEVKATVSKALSGDGKVSAATTPTELYYTPFYDSYDYDWLEAVASSGLDKLSQKLVTLYLLGYTAAEASRAYGLHVRAGQRMIHSAFATLRAQGVGL